MANTPISKWAGAYTTTTSYWGSFFSPLIVNEDGSIDIDGTSINPTYDPATSTLSFDWTTIKSTTAKGQITFSEQNGKRTFSGTINPRHQDGPVGFSGTEIVPLPVPSLSNLILAVDLFATGDQTFITAANGKGFTTNFLPNSDQKVTATGGVETSDNLVIEKTPDGKGIYIKVVPGGGANRTFYYRMKSDNLLYADATSTEQATPFQVFAALNGQAVIGTGTGNYLSLNADNTISLAPERQLGMAMEFSFSMYDIPVEQLLAQRGIAMPETLTDCQMAWARLIWQLTGGLFLALGLGPFIASGRAQVGVFGLLRANATVWNAIQQAMARIVANTNPAAVAGATFALLTVIYQQGMMWTLIKFVLSTAGWWIVFRVIAKIFEVIVLPEAEAADLIASFAVWAAQTVQAALKVANTCTSEVEAFPALAVE